MKFVVEKKFPWLILALISLSGCHSMISTTESTEQDIRYKVEKYPVTAETVSPPIQEEEATQPLPTVNIDNKEINWSESLQQLTNRLLKQAEHSASVKLLVDKINNSTALTADLTQLDESLSKQLRQSSSYTLVTDDEVLIARAMLGLQAEDSLQIRSKARGLAKLVDAPLILFTTIEGSEEKPQLSMQLMQVATGELVWSTTADVIYVNE